MALTARTLPTATSCPESPAAGRTPATCAYYGIVRAVGPQLASAYGEPSSYAR